MSCELIALRKSEIVSNLFQILLVGETVTNLRLEILDGFADGSYSRHVRTLVQPMPEFDATFAERLPALNYV